MLSFFQQLRGSSEWSPMTENVTLHFAPVDGRNWLMRITDDGGGLSNDERLCANAMIRGPGCEARNHKVKLCKVRL